MGAFRAQSIRNLATHVCVGVGAASFWRGAWYVLDDHLFPDNAVHSAAASMGLGVAGLAASQGLVARAERLAHGARVRPVVLAATRFGAIYAVAASCVLVWRGTWVGWDVLYERTHPHADARAIHPGHATASGILSHAAALTLLLGTGLFASVLAPPAAVSVIRDHSVRSVTRQYTAPAQTLVNQMFRGSTAVRGMQSSAAARSLSNNRGGSRTRPSMTGSSSTHRRGTKL